MLCEWDPQQRRERAGEHPSGPERADRRVHAPRAARGNGSMNPAPDRVRAPTCVGAPEVVGITRLRAYAFSLGLEQPRV
jgi:hypothetical protein